MNRSVAETVSVVADPSRPPRTALPESLVLAQEKYRALGPRTTPVSPARTATSSRR